MRAALIIALLCAPVTAQARKLHPMVAGLGIGLAHMLGTIEPHPAGCPARLFCGCGVSVRVFGHSVRDLWLASNWFRFPRGSLSPGNVIVTTRHVKYIDHFDGDEPMCYDPNSGGGLTRIQPCHYSGETIVSPR